MKMYKVQHTWKEGLWFRGQGFDIFTLKDGGKIRYFSPQKVYEAFGLDWNEGLSLLKEHPFYSRFTRYGHLFDEETILLLLPMHFFDTWISTLPLSIYDEDEEVVWKHVDELIAIHIRCNEGESCNLAEFWEMCFEEEDKLRVAYGKPPVPLEARGIIIEDEDEDEEEDEDYDEETFY